MNVRIFIFFSGWKRSSRRQRSIWAPSKQLLKPLNQTLRDSSPQIKKWMSFLSPVVLFILETLSVEMSNFSWIHNNRTILEALCQQNTFDKLSQHHCLFPGAMAEVCIIDEKLANLLKVTAELMRGPYMFTCHSIINTSLSSINKYAFISAHINCNLVDGGSLDYLQ